MPYITLSIIGIIDLHQVLILKEKGLKHDIFRYFDLFSIKHKTLMKKTARKLWHNTIFYKLCTKLNSFI